MRANDARGIERDHAADVRALRARFDVVERRLVVAGEEVRILHPRSAEDLIDEEAFARDERLPYWADVWPSATVLAGHVAALDGHGRSLVELGCGVGLVCVAAARAGFRVLATDYYPEALEFTRVNVIANVGVAPDVRLIDWRALPDDLERADVVVASDVLYERPYAELVAAALERALASGGVAYVADPGRVAAPSFLEAARHRGLRVADTARIRFAEGDIRQTITLYELRH